MMRKTLLALAAAASFAVAGLATVAPAQAGYWYHGVWYDVVVVPRHYHCHWEWRKYERWHHGERYIYKRKVKVCD